jgi:hypothetical protein
MSTFPDSMRFERPHEGGRLLVAGRGTRATITTDAVEISGVWHNGQPGAVFLWRGEALDLAREILDYYGAAA